MDQLFNGFGQPYGNMSAQSNSVTIDQKDVTAPSVPINLVATSSTSGAVTLKWSPSNDDVGVASYRVYRGGTQIADVTGPATFSETIGQGTYIYTVDAVDAAGNRSAQSAPAAVIVNGPAVVLTVPVITSAAASPDIHGRSVFVTWSSPTSSVGVTGFGIYRSTKTAAGAGTPIRIADVNSATLSYTDPDLATGTYTYTVDAVDSAANRSGTSAPVTVVIANDPPLAPHSLIAFPARDFISATGYTSGTLYTFGLFRAGQASPYASGSQVADSTGLIEVNHPGGTCWVGTTPDMRPGDVIRITDVASGIAEQTTIANVMAQRPVAVDANTVVIHGTAMGADGKPLLIEQIQHRLVANRDLFDMSGKRTLRAAPGLDGTLSYDSTNNPLGINWTATYTGLSTTDVIRAVGGSTTTGVVYVGAESRAVWLGRDPLALTESTIFENGPGVVGGPSAPCTATAETPVASAAFSPAVISFPATKVGSTSSASVTFSNVGTAPMTLASVYVAGLNPGDFVIAGNTCPTSLASNVSCLVSVTFSPGATGLRQANLSFSDNAANTTDQTVALTGTDDTAAGITATPTPLAFGTVNAGTSLASKAIDVKNTGAGLLIISKLTMGGAAAADFKISENCTTAPVAPNGSCKIDVQFNPTALGSRSATLTLNHNQANANLATSTTVLLSGTGGSGAVLSFNSNPVQFGTVNRGATKDQTITIKNSGNAAAQLGNFQAAGTGYSFLSTTCGTLAINNSCNVIVRFTAPATVSTFNGTFSVTAANGFPATVTTNLTATTK
jgi:hypothetical protein